VTQFPICNRRVVGANLDGHLFLKQAQVQPVLSDVVAKCLNLRRILGRRWFLSPQVDMAKGQRIPVRVGTEAIPRANAAARHRRSSAIGVGSRDRSVIGST